MVKKRELSLCAIIVAICFVVSQSLSVYAVTNSTLTSQQLGTIFDGVESIVVQLEGIGLSEADISVKMSTLNSTFFHIFIVLPFCTIRSLFYCIFSLLDNAIARLPLLPASHAPLFPFLCKLLYLFLE